jgi:hypothetical protein
MRKNEVILFTEGYHKNGQPKVMKDGGPVLKAIKDPKTFARIDEIMHDQNENGFSLINLHPTDPQRLHYMQGLDPSQQTLVLDTLSRFQKASVENQSFIIDSHHRQAKNELAKLIRKDLPGTNDEVRLATNALYDSFRQGRASGNLTMFNNMIQAYGIQNQSLAPWLDHTINEIARTEHVFSTKPQYVTERRMKRYHVVWDDHSGKPTSRRDFDNTADAMAWAKEMKDQGHDLIYDRGGFRDMWERHGGVSKGYDQFVEQVKAAENKAVIPLYQQMLQRGEINQAVFDDLVASRKDFAYALSNENIDATLGTLQPNAKFRPGREYLNMMEQHMRYSQKLARSLTAAETNGAIAFEKMNPALVNDPKGWEVLMDTEKHVANYRVPDSAWGRAITKGIFGYYMGGNLSSALIEATQAPLSLSPKLAEEGAGYAKAYSLPFQAAEKIARFNMTGKWDSGTGVVKNGGRADAYQVLLNRAESEGWIGMGLQQEIRQMDFETMLNLGSMTAGKMDKGKGVLGTMTGAYMNMVSKLYGTFAAYNEKISFISAFDLKKEQMFGNKKDLTASEFEQVYQDCVRVVTVANNNAGRIARPQGWFNNTGEWRGAAQAMYSLGSYNAGALSNLWRYARHGITKDIQGLTPVQQKNARRAATMAFSSLIGAAGLIGGIPFAGPIMALLDEHTDLEVEKNIRLGAYHMGEEINGKEGGTFVADMATHGFAYAMGLPMDISSRVAMNGMLGFNAYEGWSAKALLGPIGSIGQTASDAVMNVMQGDITRGVETALPPAFRRLWSLWANDGALTDRKGMGLYKPTHGEMTMMAMGFQPRDVAAMREAQRLQYKGDRVRQDANERLQRDAAKVAQTNPAEARQMLHKYSQENPGYSFDAGVGSVVEYLNRGKFGYDPTRAGNAQAGQDNMEIMKSFGGMERFHPAPEVDYFKDKFTNKARLGGGIGDVRSGLIQSLLTDRLAQTRGIPIPAARAVASSLRKPVSPQTHPLLEAFLQP